MRTRRPTDPCEVLHDVCHGVARDRRPHVVGLALGVLLRPQLPVQEVGGRGEAGELGGGVEPARFN
jgi:hypothetical protein